MDHFPIFLATTGRRIVVSGGAEAAEAKLRILMKTRARLSVFASAPSRQIEAWAEAGKLTLIPRALGPGDALCVALFYAANEDAEEDARTAALARADGALVNIVDTLADSQFITPAIVDRDPVTIAIGTEGAAPVLARAIKADLEAKLPTTPGPLARSSKVFRKHAEALPFGRKRRDFWRDFYFQTGPRAIAESEAAVKPALQRLLNDHLTSPQRAGHVAFVGAGPGDPELLTLKARRHLDEADVVIHDRLIAPEILELARREALVIDAGKEGFGPSMTQERINQLIVDHARQGLQVVRLKGGDCAIFARLDEEIDALQDAGITWHIIPGITSASAAAAALGQSLTKRGRNSSVRFLTGHDMQGFADHDWAALAKPGAVAAIYMGKKAMRFIQARLLMHAAPRTTPVTLIENVSRPDQRLFETTLGQLSSDTANFDLKGPVLTFYGLAPRAAAHVLTTVPTQEFA